MDDIRHVWETILPECKSFDRLKALIIKKKKLTGVVPVYFDRHRDDERFDNVTVEIIPRYKTSGLSGDEWRFTHIGKLFWKGHCIGKRFFFDMQDALRDMDWWVRNINEMVDFNFKEYDDGSHEDHKIQFPPERVLVEYCAQPGCPNKATHTFVKKQRWTRNGEAKMDDLDFVHGVRYCQLHTTRGDCGLEDCDSNLELIEALVNADESERGRRSQESI